MSARTRRHYAVHVLQFGRWLVATGRAVKNPFAGLQTAVNVENDRRRRRRALSPEDCQRLLAAAAASKPKLGGMIGPDRRIFYALAVSTGLRRNELGSLTPESFQLDTEPPTVTVGGKWTKNQKMAVLPLRSRLGAAGRVDRQKSRLPTGPAGPRMKVLALGSVCTSGGGPGLQNQWRV